MSTGFEHWQVIASRQARSGSLMSNSPYLLNSPPCQRFTFIECRHTRPRSAPNLAEIKMHLCIGPVASPDFPTVALKDRCTVLDRAACFGVHDTVATHRCRQRIAFLAACQIETVPQRRAWNLCRQGIKKSIQYWFTDDCRSRAFTEILSNLCGIELTTLVTLDQCR